ncbi:hypothetical protein [Dactylosporangium sp. NPDC000521]|uniref:hypothetical protein n=1 Tax=Dactylosporangium sp. NPDC000521 TaxID=3363975 RepID=UPI00367AEA3E
MSIELEQALRDAFRDAAGTVVPRPEPMRRLLRRRRRRWAGLLSLLATLAVAIVAGVVPAVQPATSERQRPYPPLAKWTRALLDSPTRGSLAGDADLLRAVRSSFAGGVKVLFLGDVSGRRFLVYVRYDEHSATLYQSDIPVQGSVEDLVGGAVEGQLGPLVTVTSTTVPVTIGLAPAACTIERSIGASPSPENTVEHKWASAPDGSWTAWASPDPQERWQVSCYGKVRSEAPAVLDTSSYTNLISSAGIQHEPLRQRWSGPIEGSAGTWTLSTARLPSGGVAVVLADAPAAATVATTFTAAAAPGRGGAGVVSTSISADPDMIVIRVPSPSGRLSDRVLIFTAKPGATQAYVRAELGALGAALTGGVTVTNARPGPVAVRDAAGVEIGSTWLLEEVPQLFGERLVSDWES